MVTPSHHRIRVAAYDTEPFAVVNRPLFIAAKRPLQ